MSGYLAFMHNTPNLSLPRAGVCLFSLCSEWTLGTAFIDSSNGSSRTRSTLSNFRPIATSFCHRYAFAMYIFVKQQMPVHLTVTRESNEYDTPRTAAGSESMESERRAWRSPKTLDVALFLSYKLRNHGFLFRKPACSLGSARSMLLRSLCSLCLRYNQESEACTSILPCYKFVS